MAKCPSFRHQMIASLFYAADDICIQRRSFGLMYKASPFVSNQCNQDVTEDNVLLLLLYFR